MAIPRYFAMTAQEYATCKSPSKGIAWMACHFSNYGDGLQNLPPRLPDKSLLILDDSTPPSAHSPDTIRKNVEDILKRNNFSGILLDFQREKLDITEAIVAAILEIDFPICVSALYAEDSNCPIFLPPTPPSTALPDYIKPWKGREIWLDISLGCEQIFITENGSACNIIKSPGNPFPLADKELHCHYRIRKNDDGFKFTLQRTKEDLEDLLIEAESLGVCAAVGLYQELK